MGLILKYKLKTRVFGPLKYLPVCILDPSIEAFPYTTP